jgi:putative (di)nucleoside polyphosphate hydrolase
MGQDPNSRDTLKKRRVGLSERTEAKAKTGFDKQSSAQHHMISYGEEPTLTMLLAEPEIQMLMRADRVNAQDLIAELNTISAQLRKNASLSQQTADRLGRNDADYRSGIGVMLLNRQGQVFVARRNDVEGEAWQMPQGGIDSGETPRQAALRELREEIGTDDAEIIAESKEWLYYDVPADLAQKAWTKKWRGQRQKWFVLIFKGQDSDIDLATEHPEFNAWRWVPVEELSALVVPFKRQIYINLLGEFATVFRD